FHRHVNHAVDQCLRLLGGTQCFFVIDAAGRISTISDQHEHLAPLAVYERFSSEVNGVIERRGPADSHFVDCTIDLVKLGGEWHHLVHVSSKGVQRDCVLGTNDGV